MTEGGELRHLEDLAIKMIVTTDGLRSGKTEYLEATSPAANGDGDEGVSADGADNDEVGSKYGSDSE